jgi:hypothetical protein
VKHTNYRHKQYRFTDEVTRYMISRASKMTESGAAVAIVPASSAQIKRWYIACWLASTGTPYLENMATASTGRPAAWRPNSMQAISAQTNVR